MTTIKAQGEMTRDLVTPFHIGDRVRSLVAEDLTTGRVRVGDMGLIRAAVISDPDDGDDTFLMFDVAVPGGVVSLRDTEFELVPDHN
jgi:hypothetical protein